MCTWLVWQTTIAYPSYPLSTWYRESMSVARACVCVCILPLPFNLSCYTCVPTHTNTHTRTYTHVNMKLLILYSGLNEHFDNIVIVPWLDHCCCGGPLNFFNYYGYYLFIKKINQISCHHCSVFSFGVGFLHDMMASIRVAPAVQMNITWGFTCFIFCNLWELRGVLILELLLLCRYSPSLLRKM